MKDITNKWGLFVNDFLALDDDSYGKTDISTYYKLCVVSKGKGVLKSAHVGYDIKEGDLFMTLPHQGYAIINNEGLRVIAVSIAGLRGVELAKELLDNVRTPVFSGYESFIPMWEQSLENYKITGNPLLPEGLLLYTLGSIPGKGVLKGNYKKRQYIMLQTYIRTNFNNPALSLESVASAFGYNKKYLSDLFKRKFDISFSEFLRNVRLENACSLMQLGNTSVGRIATLSGFSDPLYFSKLFKEKYGVSPKGYIANLE